MDYLDLVKELAVETDSKIVMLIMDGLGGLPREPGGPTELASANTPNMDELATKSSLGLLDPIAPGITPGSGPGHLALFGYDPVRWNMGRGVLEALGIDFPLKKGDVAIRINFCTVDKHGVVTDRRAGRISTEKCEELSAELDKIQAPGAELTVSPVKEHRAVLVIRAEGLSGNIKDTDPQVTGKKPLPVTPLDDASKKTSEITEQFLAEASRVLAPHDPANMVLLRGFDTFKDYPSFNDIYNLKAAAIAHYPMYKGLARMVGMDVLRPGQELENLVDCVEENWKGYTFFFVHVKKTDSAGEDGDFDSKVSVIESVDELVPRILGLGPEVLLITGDHSTPWLLQSHSWHPVPVLVHSKSCRIEGNPGFSEHACKTGSMGRLPTVSLMPVAMANALKLAKFGA